MSKKSKSLSKQANLRAKQAKKAANRALYDSRKRMGENTKSSRSVRKSRGRKGKEKGKHLVAYCGNIACMKCHTHTNKGVYPIGRQFSVRGVATLKRAA